VNKSGQIDKLTTEQHRQSRNITTPFGRARGCGMTPKVLREVAREAATRAGIENLARTTCGVLVPGCVSQVANCDQIQFLLGYVPM
jgi:hypothetical protein